MLVFRYDKTFDGLLSALFDAYSIIKQENLQEQKTEKASKKK